jgi:O-antigen/teichoic acid export membrane protein
VTDARAAPAAPTGTAVPAAAAPAPAGRRLWVGLALNGAARALTVAVPMVTLPMMTGSLGRTNYGAYAVITSIAAFLPWADLGIGLGLVTAVSQASGRRDLRALRATVSTGLVMLLGVAAALLALGLLLGLAVDWRAVLGLTDPGVTGDVGLAVLFGFVSFAVGIPVNLGMKVMLALQLNRALAFWQAAAVPAVVIAVAAAWAASASLPWFVLATLGTPNLVALAAALWLFRRARPDVAPHWALADPRAVRGLLVLGVVFSVNSAAAAIGYETNAIVLSHVVGVDEVGIYNISARLSTVALLVFQSLLLPLWPLFGAGVAGEDYAGTRTRLRHAVLFSVAAGTITAVVFVAAARPVVELWVGPAYVPSVGLLVALAVWSVVQFAGYPYALLLSGAGAKRFLVVTAVAMAATNLPLSIVLAHGVGVAGPVWGSCVATVLIVLVPSIVYVRRYVGRRALSPGAPVSVPEPVPGGP